MRVACEKIVAQYSDVPAALRGQFATELVTAYALFLDDTESAARFDADVNAKSYLISPATILEAAPHWLRQRATRRIPRCHCPGTQRCCIDPRWNWITGMETHWFDLIEKRIANQSMVQAKP